MNNIEDRLSHTSLDYIAIKSNAGAADDDCIRDAIILSMETGKTVSVDHGFDSYTVDFNTLINTVRATRRC